MTLTPENQKIIQEWITTKCGAMKCFCCGQSLLTLIDFSSLQIGFDVNTTRFHYNQGLPLISIICNNCGHVIQFNPGAMGIKPEIVPEAKIEEPK